MKGFSPVISATDAVEASVEAAKTWGLERLLPSFLEYGPEARLLPAVWPMPDPTAATPTLPEVVDLSYVMPAVAPDLAWPDFVAGAAVCALAVDRQSHDKVKQALIASGESMLAGGEYPPIDLALRPEVEAVYSTIVANGETATWRNIMAFTLGAFWLLGFVQEPHLRRGPHSPFQFVSMVTTYAAQMGYVPR